jgi:Mg2+-importing ATPase
VVLLAIALPYTPLGPRLGFVPVPPAFFGLLVLLVAAYLGATEIVKWHFFHREISHAA